MSFFKEWMCDHVWKTIKYEDLGRITREFDTYTGTYDRYKMVARTEECIKCNKTRIVEGRVWII